MKKQVHLNIGSESISTEDCSHHSAYFYGFYGL